MFDSHIHLDQFSDAEIYAMLQTAELNGVLAVATQNNHCLPQPNRTSYLTGLQKITPN